MKKSFFTDSVSTILQLVVASRWPWEVQAPLSDFRINLLVLRNKNESKKRHDVTAMTTAMSI